MNDFRAALDLVITGLRQIERDTEHPPRASLELLTRIRHLQRSGVESRDPEEVQPTNTPPGPSASLGMTKAEKLRALAEPVSVCVKCPHLARFRAQTVFGVGNADADLMFIGEAPGADEDARGEPFVGRAGQLLTKIIETMGFARADVYIANVLKCRPDMPPGMSGNRPPTPEEMATCLPYLAEQISIVQPKVLVALGATAVEGLLGFRGAMRELRGRWHSYRDTPLMITYHPSYLLRNQTNTEKRKVWEDMLLVLDKLDRPITEKQQRYFL